MYDRRILGRSFEPERKAETELYELRNEKLNDMRLNEIFCDDEIKMNDMVRSCSTHGEKCIIQDVGQSRKIICCTTSDDVSMCRSIDRSTDLGKR